MGEFELDRKWIEQVAKKMGGGMKQAGLFCLLFVLLVCFAKDILNQRLVVLKARCVSFLLQMLFEGLISRDLSETSL